MVDIYILFPAIDALKLAAAIVGMERRVYINTGIYKHNIFDDKKILNKKEDRIVIRGSKTNPISLNDVLDAYKIMKKQFDFMDENNMGRSYYYEDLRCIDETHYEICWGS
jgi:hypothetical protein